MTTIITMRRIRTLLMFVALIGSAGYAMADGGGGEASNCCAKAADCKEVDNESACDAEHACTSTTYKSCCIATCPEANN